MHGAAPISLPDGFVDNSSCGGSFSMYMRCLHRSMDCRVAWILLDLGILGVLGQGVRMFSYYPYYYCLVSGLLQFIFFRLSYLYSFL